MNPSQFLLLGLLATAAAVAGQWIARTRQVRAVKTLAAQWRLNYSPTDRLQLTSRLAGRLPVPGAADVRVFDLIYGADQQLRRYLFTAEYGVGVFWSRQRLRRVIAFSEPVDQAADDACPASPPPLRLAPPELPIIEQYRRLHEEN